MAADPLLAVQAVIVKLLPDLPKGSVCPGERQEGHPPELVLLQASGGPRQRGYSSKARIQIQVCCYSYAPEKAWARSEAIYNRLNAIATERVDYADSDAMEDPLIPNCFIPNRHTCLLSVLSATGPQQSRLGDEPLATCQDTYTVLYSTKEETP